MPERKQYFTQLAGEYLTAGELFRQEIFACVTFGSAKPFDIVAVGKDNKMAKIEVKASRNSYSHIKKPDNYPCDNHWQFNSNAARANKTTVITFRYKKRVGY